MNKNTFCTIITSNYLPYAYALYDSLSGIDPSIELNVLISDFNKSGNYELKSKNIRIHDPNDLINKSTIGRKIWEKYNTENTQSELRWSLKPAFISYLFDQGYEKVLFTDGDTFYYSSFSLLFNYLDNNNVILIPHWRGLYPGKNSGNFDLQFVGGLFNAGFVGVNKEASHIMKWWGELCWHRCELDFTSGFYGDQTYLNLMPIYFDNVKILKHQGCNVANWNQDVCKRELINGRVLINGKYDVVFIHFTASMFKGIVNGKDRLLKPQLNEYVDALKKNGKELNLDDFVEINKMEVKRDKYWKAKNWLNKKIHWS